MISHHALLLPPVVFHGAASHVSVHGGKEPKPAEDETIKCDGESKNKMTTGKLKVYGGN